MAQHARSLESSADNETGKQEESITVREALGKKLRGNKRRFSILRATGSAPSLRSTRYHTHTCGMIYLLPSTFYLLPPTFYLLPSTIYLLLATLCPSLATCVSLRGNLDVRGLTPAAPHRGMVQEIISAPPSRCPIKMSTTTVTSPFKWCLLSILVIHYSFIDCSSLFIDCLLSIIIMGVIITSGMPSCSRLQAS